MIIVRGERKKRLSQCYCGKQNHYLVHWFFVNLLFLEVWVNTRLVVVYETVHLRSLAELDAWVVGHHTEVLGTKPVVFRTLQLPPLSRPEFPFCTWRVLELSAMYGVEFPSFMVRCIGVCSISTALIICQRSVFVFNYVPQHNNLCMKVHLSTKFGHIKLSRTFIFF
jgi:hypothetical protein